MPPIWLDMCVECGGRGGFWSPILPMGCAFCRRRSFLLCIMRSQLLEVLNQDYIRTARSKGLKESKIISGHAVKNALIPILTLIGLTLRNSIGGSAIIERVFNITGMGSVMVEALAARDYIALQSGIVFLALITCICNLLVDIAYAYADPRIRLE